jgi:hypothetical protein
MARKHPRVPLPTLTPGDPPPPLQRAGRHDWNHARQRLEDNPGVWIMVFPAVTTGTFHYASRGRLTAFIGMGGYLESRIRGQKPVGRSAEGELWMRWEPAGWTEEDQARANAAATAGEGQL